MVNDRFIELLSKRLSDEIGESELAELNKILAEDEECRQQYNFFKGYWIQDQEKYSNDELIFQRVKSRIDIEEIQDDPEQETGRVKRMPIIWRSIAAILLLGLCVFLYHYYSAYSYKSTLAPTITVTKTPSRSKSKIYLTDGSVVTLNSETVLKYPSAFTGPTREVYLSGEAFFDVAKDHTHPFIVHAGKMNIKVLGTAFNVKSYSNDKNIETTLIRGAIEVTLSDRPSDRIILKPNEKLILNNTTFQKEGTKRLTALPEEVNTNYSLTRLTHLKSNDTTIVETSWVNNELVFKDEAFGDLANQMERWYGIKFKFKNDDTRDYHFTGVFVKENVFEALNALKLIESFNYKYKNETVYIY
ncbi:FecR family protein [Mucilaginibacter ginsenosidivorans]|uniref:FecR family protein n=1 Tax=Mucilaginibacter ginsenosidivorans TaxID=398053 RepID=A0A5B8UYE1_9SPHI|nr:FecR family protein [Mucilaginibacter ginsenosidivorans]QEC64104.1 FecR family protein [Mucilaginibacter ginsenosidivorans]